MSADSVFVNLIHMSLMGDHVDATMSRRAAPPPAGGAAWALPDGGVAAARRPPSDPVGAVFQLFDRDRDGVL